jgi:hypothetical protein
MMTDAVERARGDIAAALARLAGADVATETLAVYRPAHRTLLIPRPGSFATVGPVWRLGVLLLGADGALFATGAVTRARDPKHPNYTSVSGEERRELREAARRAGFGTRDTVDFDADPLPLDDSLGTIGPLVLRDGALTVSWNASRSPESLRPFADYLRERVELLVEPPAGAGETER